MSRTPGRTSPLIARSKPSPAHGPVDLRPDLAALVVEEALARFVGDGQVGRPGHGEGAALGAEHDELEPERAAVGRGQMAGVVPPLGQPVVGRVVAREHRRDRVVGPCRGRRWPRRAAAASGPGWRGWARSTPSRPGRTRRGEGDLDQSGPTGLVTRPPRPAVASSASARGARASTSSSARGAASSRARAGPARRSRRGRPRSRRRGRPP